MFDLSTTNTVNPFFWLMVLATVVAMMGRYIKIPYALALVIVGFFAGAAGLLPQVFLDPHILFAIFLPPLLFEAAINMRLSLLAANWKPVSIYALAGTLLAAFATAGLAYRLLGMPLEAALVFGALISPTDPISVIAIFRELRVGKDLTMIMEAESLFNDGIAIVLYTFLVTFALGQTTTIWQGIGSFFIVVAGGAALGGAIGLIASRITQEFDDHLLEIMLTTIVVFGSYSAAEWFHVSGVIAVVAAGLAMGSHGMKKGMSATTRLAVNSFWEYAAFVVNSLVFLLVGFEVTLVNLQPLLPMIVAAFFVVLAGRAIAIYGLSPIIKSAGYRVPFPWQHILFWGGLRGAIPMALALSLDQSFPGRDEILLLTFGVVLISLLLQGLSTKPLIKRLGLATNKSWQAEHNRLASQIMAAQEATDELALLKKRKVLSDASYLHLAGQYQQRIDALENQIENLRKQSDKLTEMEEKRALRQALITEKSSLREAYNKGMIDAEDWQQLSFSINDQLDALEQSSGN